MLGYIYLFTQKTIMQSGPNTGNEFSALTYLVLVALVLVF